MPHRYFNRPNAVGQLPTEPHSKSPLHPHGSHTGGSLICSSQYISPQPELHFLLRIRSTIRARRLPNDPTPSQSSPTPHAPMSHPSPTNRIDKQPTWLANSPNPSNQPNSTDFILMRPSRIARLQNKWMLYPKPGANRPSVRFYRSVQSIQSANLYNFVC